MASLSSNPYVAAEPLAPETPTRRIPNLWHLLLFLALTFFATIVAVLLVLAVAHPHPLMAGLTDQRLMLIASMLGYMLALAGAWVLFPALWQMSFLDGIRFRAQAANGRTLGGLIGFGLVLGVVSQATSTLLPAPKKMPIDDVLSAPGAVWVLVVFGTLVAPLFEEIVFRGFLLPGIASLVDWIRLPRPVDPLAAANVLFAWRTAEISSSLALIVASVLTSTCFALVHALQLGFNWAPIALLFCVSMVLCWVRLRLRSVAASTVVHACYNLSVFITIYVVTSGFHHLDRA